MLVVMELKQERGNKVLRFLDRYIGIPIVCFLGLLKSKKRLIKDDHNLKRFAFLKTAAIGDTVLLSAAIRDLKAVYSDVDLTLFTGFSNYEIANQIKGIENIICIPTTDPLKAIRIIRESGIFDIWCDFGSWPRLDAMFSFFSHARYKIGFKTQNQFRHYAYDVYVEHSEEEHEVENYKDLLRQINIIGDNMPFLDSESCYNDENIVAVHMFPGGSRSYLKEWPEQNWISLIQSIVDSDYKVYITGAKENREMALRIGDSILRREFIYVTAGEYNLRETISLINSSQLVISVDTGIMHIASALDRNLISLHGPTSKKRWGPLNKKSVVISAELECSPCISLGFDSKCRDNRCMKHITVERVLAAVNGFITMK